uniref:Uncharacterized protein n=1 Tax=Cyanistes caeruleus TaxID=156563 RepID=A0A8C0VK59_CYACU
MVACHPCVLTCPLQGSLPQGMLSWWGRRGLHNLCQTTLFSVGPSTCWAQPVLKQQWQQMKMKAMRTTKGRPNRTARQTVLKMPSSCLVRMSSKMELKKELIFCCISMLLLNLV